jgi:hypothetical protein
MTTTDLAHVVVTWRDAHSETSWTYADDLDREPYEVVTCGWLVPDGKPAHVVVAQSVGADGALDGVLCVPIATVVSVVVVSGSA